MKYLLTLLCLLWAFPAEAARLPHARAAALNAEVDAIFARVDAAQATWRSMRARRRYIQLLKAPVARDGNTATRPALDAKTPRDRRNGMRDLGFINADSLFIDYVIDEYVTPSRGHPNGQHGYLIHAEVQIAGQHYRRTRQFGPEDFGFVNSANGWYILSPGAP